MHVFVYDASLNRFHIASFVNELFGFDALQVRTLCRFLPIPLLTGRPAEVVGLRRGWFVAREGHTTLGAYFSSKSVCTGVVYDLNELQLERLAQLWPEFELVTLPREAVSLGEAVACFVVQKSTIASPCPERPILQSVVDTALEGCLDFGVEFARRFVATTHSWNKNWRSDGRVYPQVDEILMHQLGPQLVAKIKKFRR